MTRTALSVSLLASLLFGLPSQALQPSVGAAAAAADAAAPTPEDVKAAYEKKDYKETLRLVGRVLSLKGRAAEGIDRYEMLVLKAESHLKMQATTNAIQSLEEAAKVAPGDEEAAKAKGLVILVKRSKNLQYTPKVTAGSDDKAKGPLDVTDPDQREAALKAIYLEEKAATRTKLQAAAKAKTLPPLAAALKAVIPLKDLERAATGHDAETAETVNQLTDRAHKLMARELDDMTKRTERIAARAKELYEYSVPSRIGDNRTEIRTGMRGLQQKDVQELKATIKTCKQIMVSCKELAEGFAEEDEPFEDLEDLARDTGERANDVLNDDYKIGN
jgi:hypothetical protein